jgi:hypothetical protein
LPGYSTAHDASFAAAVESPSDDADLRHDHHSASSSLVLRPGMFVLAVSDHIRLNSHIPIFMGSGVPSEGHDDPVRRGRVVRRPI